MRGDLDREGPDAPGSSVDEHVLIGPQTGVIHEGLPRRERRQWDGCRRVVVDRDRLGGQDVRWDADELRSGAVADEGDQAVDLIAHLDLASPPAPSVATTPDISCEGTIGVRSRPPGLGTVRPGRRPG